MENKSWLEITKEETDAIYQEEKIISEDVIWSKNNNSHRLKIPVYFKNKIDSNIKMEVLGVRNIKYSFVFICNNNLKIRRWDFKGYSSLNNKPHKHYFDGDINPKKFYIVEDIPINDVNIAFICFLKECNIELKGNYQSII